MGERIDVALAAGRIVRVGPAGTVATDGASVLDVEGYVLLPSPVEPHAHLDKTLLASRVLNPSGDLAGAIAGMRDAGALDPADVQQRARRALAIAIARGVTAIRTHVDCTEETGLSSLQALRALRAELVGVVDLQIVALIGSPVTGSDGTRHRALLRRIVADGRELIGGVPSHDPDPIAATRLLVDAAADTGTGCDLHIDETLDPTMCTLETFAEVVERRGLGGRAAASHCVSLGQQGPAVAARVAERLAAANVAVVTLPQTNLVLQGRDRDTCVPRGLPPLGVLRRAGVTLAGGGDNWRDPFNPVGRIDPLETAALLVSAGHLPLVEAYAAVSDAARRVLGLEQVALQAGAPADLLALRGESFADALADASDDRIVIRAGEVLARTRLARQWAPAASLILNVPLP